MHWQSGNGIHTSQTKPRTVGKFAIDKFVIGGHTVGGKTFDALVFGCYEGRGLIYAARTRNGFTPQLRAGLMKKFKPVETENCPFVIRSRCSPDNSPPAVSLVRRPVRAEVFLVSADPVGCDLALCSGKV